MGIEIITGPNVYLVGRQEIDADQLDRFLHEEGVDAWTSDTDIAGQKLIEVGGRLCYQSYAKPRPGGNAAYIDHILEMAHGAVIEHAVFNLIITGVSRSFTHELVRHRAGWSYSQRSQRFCDESGLSAVVPPALREEVEAALTFHRENFGDAPFSEAYDIDPGVHRKAYVGLVWLWYMEATVRCYRYLSDYLTEKRKAEESDPTLRRKQAREAARSVLPNATETKIFVTANARALRHFLELRGTRHADAEMRRVAIAILEILSREAPAIFGDFTLDLSFPGGEIVCRHHKV